MTARQPILSPAAWYGADLGRRTDWIRNLTPGAIDEIDRATKSVVAKGIPLYEATKKDFPLDQAADQLRMVGEEVEGAGNLGARHLGRVGCCQHGARIAMLRAPTEQIRLPDAPIPTFLEHESRRATCPIRTERCNRRPEAFAIGRDGRATDGNEAGLATNGNEA